MPSIYFREKVLLGVKEDVYGTEEVLDGATNAILTRDLNIEFSAGDTEELTYDNGGLGHGVLRKTNSHMGLSFMTDFAGSGTAGTAPAWGFLAEACGFEETIEVGTSAEYAFSDTPTSLTLAYRNGPNLHPGVGARGMVEIDLTPAKHPTMKWNFQALRVNPSNSAMPTLDVGNWATPIAVNFANTTAIELFGYTVALTACVIQFGQQVEVINVPGMNLVDIMARKPVANITILEPGISAKNFYALQESGELGNFEMVHGVGAGKILTLASPALTQITNIQRAEYKGRTALSMTLRFVDGDDGQSDFTILNT